MFYAQLLIDEYFAGYKPDCKVPRHGPGAVAGGEKLNDKWKFSTLFESLHREWPYYEYHYGVRSREYDKGLQSVKSRAYQLAAQSSYYRTMRRVKEPTARLLFVPKDSRGPRIICCEPKELMFVQQGVARHLMSYIEKHRYTKGHVNFTSQEINRALALSSSEDKAFATIDLKDASDRVSRQLIRFLFPERVVRKWTALRSSAALLPSGETLTLEKFSPQGSAMCFPVESLVFWALAVGCVWFRSQDFRQAIESVYVYGDDIIVKDEYANDVMLILDYVGLKVNTKKSFTGSHPFRESCGIDAYEGAIVTPLRIRKLPPQRPSDGPALYAYASYASKAIECGLTNRATAIEKILESLVGRLPRTSEETSYLSIVDPNNTWELEKYPSRVWDPGLQLWTSKLLTLKPRKTYSPIDEYYRLLFDITVGAGDGDPSVVVARSATQIRRKRIHIPFF